MTIPRTKGSKNKKTLLKERSLENVGGRIKNAQNFPVTPVFEEEKEHVDVRLFTLEKSVHDAFIKHISQFGDPQLYESYIVNEIVTKIVNGKLKLPVIDKSRLYDYMLGYGKVGFEPGTIIDDEISEFKAANRLIHKGITNSFIQYQYPIIVDIDIKSSIKVSPSYIVNECLKLYNIGDIKIDLRDFKVRGWEIKYNRVVKKINRTRNNDN